MKGSWDVKALGDVCEIVGGGTPAKNNSAFYSGHIPWATVRDMKNENLSTTEFRISEDAVKASSTKIIPANNVIIATRVGLGKVCLLEQDTAINQDLRGIVPKAKGLDVRYLFRWFQSIADVIESEGTGATVKGVKLTFVKALKIPIPPLPEQKRIVAILDEAFAGIETAIANTEKNLANARELFENYLNEVFRQQAESSPSSGINAVCDSIIDCVNKTAPTVNDQTPFKMIRTTNVRDGCVNLESVKYVTEETYRNWTRRQIPQKGDVILTREAPLGEVGRLDKEEKVFLGQRLVSYRTNPEKLSNQFLLYAFQSSHMQAQIYGFASGSTVQHMRVPDSKKLVIPLPEPDIQNKIVECVDLLHKETLRLESIYQQKLIALAELKQSLLQKAFSGELTAGAAEAQVKRRSA